MKTMDDVTKLPIAKPRKKTENEIKTNLQEEKQVILHCTYECTFSTRIRIWKTTYLITEKNEKIPLVHHEGISLYPTWTHIFRPSMVHFTLIFSGLPKECKVFKMEEIIPESGGFKINNIKRNSTDVYRVLI